MKPSNFLSRSFWLSFLRVGGWLGLCLFSNELAAQATVAIPTTTALQLPRNSLLQRTQLTGEEVAVYLGNALNGRTDGLEGVVYCEGGNQRSAMAGYVRWHVIFRRIDGLPFHRDDLLELRFLAWHTGYEPMVIHPVELRQGQLESRSSFLAPNRSRTVGNYWRRILCKVYRDGRQLDGLVGRDSGTYNSGIAQNAGSIANWRCVALGSAESLMRAKLVRSDQLPQFDLIESNGRWLMMASGVGLLNHFPTDWRELGGVPCFAVATGDLVRLSAEQRLALSQYVLAGGELIVANDGDIQKLPVAVEEWMKSFVPAAASQENDWSRTTDATVKKKLRTMRLGFGQLIVYEGGMERFTPAAEMMNSFHRPPRLERLLGADLMTWLIPKLGQPPVMMFCLSIGGFAVLAGPGLLWWTNIKSRRPVWLLLLFPLFSLLITSSLFAYAFFHDGFGVTGRILSLTWVDAQSGIGCSYSRQTNFSGFPPSTATFSPKSEVWEVESPHENRAQTIRREPTSEVTMLSDGDRQIFHGLLRGRQQGQILVTKPVEGLKPFDWTSGGGEKMPCVQNRLNEPWKLGVWVDDAKSVYRVERVAAGEEVELSKIPIADAIRWVTKYEPVVEYPDGYRENGSLSLFGWLGRTNRYTPFSKGRIIRDDVESMLETWLKDDLTKANRFLILLDRGEHLDRPYRGVNETDSSHWLMGTW